MDEQTTCALPTEPGLDTGRAAVLEPARRPAPDRWPRGERQRVGAAALGGRRKPLTQHRHSFSLLIVRGDGVRVLRVNFRRPLLLAGAATLAASVAMVGLLVGDWTHLRSLTREAVTFSAKITEQRTTIETFNRRIAELRQEMDGWRDLHARIQEPLGPEVAPGGRDKGIGGGTASGVDRAPAPLSPADELNRLTESVKEESEKLRALDRIMAHAGRALAALPSRWPVRGAVNSEFGNRQSPWSTVTEFHSGLDIRAQRGTPVRAPANGLVAFAGNGGEYGTMIIVDHGQDIRSLYGHLSQVAVRSGQKVERGAVLGYTGNTGRSSGPHLHYEVLVKGRAVNPRAYLWN